MRAAPIAALFVVMILALAAPVVAHQGEEHSAPAELQTEQDMAQDPGEHDTLAMDPGQLRWPTAEDMAGAHAERPTTFWGRLVRWLGAWHPAVIHFPIALVLTAASLEVAAAVRRRPIYSAGNKTLLGLGALGAFLAAPLGWISAGMPEADDAFALNVHRWLGTALPFLLLLLWALKSTSEDAASRKATPYYAALLVVAVLAILAQAYFGAETTHGAEHLAF